MRSFIPSCVLLAALSLCLDAQQPLSAVHADLPPLPPAERVMAYTTAPGLTEPVPVHKEQAPQTRCSSRAQSGAVRFTTVIDASGHPRNVMFESALANDIDRFALNALLLTQFQPATQNGEAVAVGRFVDMRLHVCLEPTRDAAGTSHTTMRLAGPPEVKLSPWKGPAIEANLAPLQMPPGVVLPDDKQLLSDVTPPMAIAHPTPPPAHEHTGTFSFRVLVDEHGLPKERQVLQSTDAELLPLVAASMEDMRYKPAIKDGMPLPTHIEESLTITPDTQ